VKLDAYLRAHEFMTVERPPDLWEADTEEVAFLSLLGETIAVALAGSLDPTDLVLNASNVTVEEDAAGDRLPAGDFVALTVRGPGEWPVETTWWPHAAPSDGPFVRLEHELREAGAAYAYTRNLGEYRSATFFLRRVAS
jgi:hypothetical protein